MYDTKPNGRVLHGQTTDVSQGFSRSATKVKQLPCPDTWAMLSLAGTQNLAWQLIATSLDPTTSTEHTPTSLRANSLEARAEDMSLLPRDRRPS